MALLEYGATAGLAYTHNWDAEMQRQNYNEQADRQAKIDAENKAKILGDKLHFDHLSNTWDNKLMQGFAETRIREIGKFVAENPNYESDAGLWAQFNQMSDELTNNDIVARSMRIQQNYESLVGYMQQNPGAENDPAIQQQLTDYDNYIKTGSVDGVTTNSKEFMFRNPDEQFNAQENIAKAYSQLAPQETYDKSGVGIGATKTEVPDAALQSTAIGLLNGPDGWRYNNIWKAMTPDQQAFYQNDPVKWLMNTGRAYTQTGVQAGAVFAPQRNTGGSGKGGNGGAEGYSPFLNDFGRLQPMGAATYSNHVDTLIPITDGKMPVNGALRVSITGTDGQPTWVNLNSYSGTTVGASPTGRVMAGAAGELYTEVVVNAPVTKELMYGETPLLKSTSWWESTYDAGQEEDDPAYSSVVHLNKNSDGDNDGTVSITAWVPANVSNSSVRAYDSSASGQSNANKVEGVAVDQGVRDATFVNTGTLPSGQRVGIDANGVMYDYATMQVIE